MFGRKRILLNHLITNYQLYLDKKIIVCGWIENIRKQGDNLCFIRLVDGSTITSLQIIVTKTIDNTPHLDNIFERGKRGVSILVNGLVVNSPAAEQLIELQASSITIYGDIDAKEYPISKNKLSMDYLRQYPHLRIRTNMFSSIARIRNIASYATHQFFQQLDFKYVHTPLLTSNDCEGAGETFVVSTLLKDPTNIKTIDNKVDYSDDFFQKMVTLTVSGQLNLEAYAMGLSDVYTFGPTFRADNSNTSRHLAEFWMIEPEISFCNLDDDINLAEDYLKYIIGSIIDKCPKELDFFNQYISPNLIDNLTKILNTPFHRISYTQAIDILLKEIEDDKVIVEDPNIEHKKWKKISKNKHIFKEPVYWGCDLGSEHEKYLTDIIFEFSPIVITNYPTEIKSFYMKENSDGKTVQAMDILVPGIGEIIGGSIREDNYQILKDKITYKGIDINSLDWYLDLRKYGSVPHGGFGLGFDRLIMLLTGITNIRDVIPFPRYVKHCPL